MTVYYAKSDKTKKKFLYVELSKEQAESLEGNIIREEDGHRVQARRQLHDHGCQFHLTTDGSFELYCHKRKETPRKVYILDTQKQLDKVLTVLGFIL